VCSRPKGRHRDEREPGIITECTVAWLGVKGHVSGQRSFMVIPAPQPSSLIVTLQNLKIFISSSEIETNLVSVL
jgi:hypothetical protein